MRTYQLVRPIGRGGMGQVFEARMQLALGQEFPCAVKLIRQEHSSSPRYRELFAREATTALKVGHPNLVRAYDFGTAESPDGRLFLVMEWVRGPDLMAAVDLLSGDYRALRRIARDVLEALRYLHRREIVHRDVTPRNILIDQSGCAKLADLGIVKRASGSGSDGFRGVPEYASPEMHAGRPTSAPSDVYSLGAVLCRTITGKAPPVRRPDVEYPGLPPFPEDTPADLVQLVRGALRDEPGERLTVDAALRLLIDSGEPLADDAELTEIASVWLDERQSATDERKQVTPLALHGAVLRFQDRADAPAGEPAPDGPPPSMPDHADAPHRGHVLALAFMLAAAAAVLGYVARPYVDIGQADSAHVAGPGAATPGQQPPDPASAGPQPNGQTVVKMASEPGPEGDGTPESPAPASSRTPSTHPATGEDETIGARKLTPTYIAPAIVARPPTMETRPL